MENRLQNQDLGPSIHKNAVPTPEFLALFCIWELNSNAQYLCITAHNE